MIKRENHYRSFMVNDAECRHNLITGQRRNTGVMASARRIGAPYEICFYIDFFEATDLWITNQR
jgi:hypothetical protein